MNGTRRSRLSNEEPHPSPFDSFCCCATSADTAIPEWHVAGDDGDGDVVHDSDGEGDDDGDGDGDGDGEGSPIRLQNEREY